MTAHAAKGAAGRGKQSAETKPRPFGAIVRDLLIERDFVTGMGNPNWSGFAVFIVRNSRTSRSNTSTKNYAGITTTCWATRSRAWPCKSRGM